jgi:tellurium resistance protein TerD
MIQVPMNSSGAVNRQTITSINERRVGQPLSARNLQAIRSGTTAQQRTAVPAPTAAHSTVPAPTAAHPTAPTPSAAHPTVPTPAPAPAPSMPIPTLQKPVQKGQKVSLENGQKLSRIRAKLGWNVNNPACDVDVSAFLLGSNGKVIGDDWFVFYGQESSPDRSTVFSMDQGQDRENISIDFTRLNPSVAKIVFVLTINEALEKRLNFSMLRDAYVRIMDASTDAELVSFKMDEYYANATSMMIGEVYRHNGSWKFNAIGSGVARDLAGLCELYGVRVE